MSRTLGFLGLFALLGVAAGCAVAPPPPMRAMGITEAELLSGETLFDEATALAEVVSPPVLEVDDEMHAFVEKHVGGIRSERERLRKLVNGMLESGMLHLDYDAVETKTAQETFHDRVGNCISFTNLFVALGRAAGLDVVYQTVDIPPVWYADSDLVVLNNHINAVVRHPFSSRVVVDFNIADFKGNYDSRAVSDEYAVALFQNNIAMDALRAGDYEKSFLYLRDSIATSPEIAASWVNLGVLYSRRKLPDYAIAAYQRALEVEPRNRSALANLELLYRSQGRTKLAATYARRIRQYQERNPYYHYYRALRSYENNEFRKSLSTLKHAIKLKGTEHQFHYLQGLVHNRLGDQQAALRDFVRARELTDFDSVKERYNEKIAFLDPDNANP